MVVTHIQGPDNIFAPCQRMATVIAEILRLKRECFPSDLGEDFSDADINRHWNMAYALAHVDLMGD
jgi:hypothetical protein